MRAGFLLLGIALRATLLTALCLGANVVAAATVAPSAVEAVFEAFEHAQPEGAKAGQAVWSGPADARQPAYFVKVLALQGHAPPAVLAMKELRVSTASGALHHLGVAHLSFKAAAAAVALQRHAASGKAYFAGTKLLTRYTVLRKDAQVLVVFSETPDTPWVEGFLRHADLQQAGWLRH